MHPRNKHQDRYDLRLLARVYPALAPYVLRHPKEGLTIDFSNSQAVRALNCALLVKDYHLKYWDFPATYLCPAIPGRADYLHYLADVIKLRGKEVRVLDVGTGASCVYPLIGIGEYGWSFVASEIDSQAITSASEIIKKNELQNLIEIRRQPDKSQIFHGIIRAGEKFELTLCNPPFYSSLAEAQQESNRKWQHLGREELKDQRNFQGQGPELWCSGGEAQFIKTMVQESADFKQQVRWFSTLVAKVAHLKEIDRSLEKLGATACHTIEMEHGQKRTRALAWTFR